VKEVKVAIDTKNKDEDLIKFGGAAEDNEEIEGEDDDSEIDDQTEALLKGFESDGDEADAEKEGGLEEGQDVPKVPDMSNRSKKQLEKAMVFKKDDKPGVVYVGRIPHGFYEHEMREYFKQFGTILKLRLSRNRKTGASKHVAWIQFESSTVAEIVAKTMDNYLLFNHILKVKVVPNEQLPEGLFKGANKRFKKIPWNKIEGRKLSQPKTEEAWEKLSAREQKKRDEKAKKLSAIGYEFDSPKIKSAKGVAKAIEAAPVPIVHPESTIENDAEIKAIEAAPTPIAPPESTTEGSSKKEEKLVSEAQGLKKKEKKDKKREKKAKAIEAAKGKKTEA
jgi:nucleolar protein 15